MSGGQIALQAPPISEISFAQLAVFIANCTIENQHFANCHVGGKNWHIALE